MGSTGSKTWTANFDGGSVGNPGPSAAAAVLVAPDGSVRRASRFLAHATNNQAEYAGLICALRLALEVNASEILILGDSLLVINQINGTWKAKDEGMIENLAEARALLARFRSAEARWVPREENSEADAEVRRCLAQHHVAAPTNAAADADLAERFKLGRFAALNAKGAGQASFQDLAGVRVGGQDAYSRKSREALIDLLGSDATAALACLDAGLTQGKTNVRPDIVASQRDKLELTALRWMARGLRPEFAAQKVLVDLELSLSAARRESR